jgi:hypothetical protein
MAVTFTSKSTLTNRLLKTNKLWDQAAVLQITVEYLVIAGGAGGGRHRCRGFRASA